MSRQRSRADLPYMGGCKRALALLYYRLVVRPTQEGQGIKVGRFNSWYREAVATLEEQEVLSQVTALLAQRLKHLWEEQRKTNN